MCTAIRHLFLTTELRLPVSLGQVSLFPLLRGLEGIFTLDLHVFGRGAIFLKEKFGGAYKISILRKEPVGSGIQM